MNMANKNNKILSKFHKVAALPIQANIKKPTKM